MAAIAAIQERKRKMDDATSASNTPAQKKEATASRAQVSSRAPAATNATASTAATATAAAAANASAIAAAPEPEEKDGLPLSFFEDLFGLKLEQSEVEALQDALHEDGAGAGSSLIYESDTVKEKARTWETDFNDAVKRARAQKDEQGNPLPSKPVADKIRVASERVWGTDVEAARAKMMAIGAQLYQQGRRPTTTASQDSAVRSWEYFCETFKFEPYPATEMSLICFTVWSASRKMIPSSIGKYIGSIRVRHLEEEAKMPDNKDMPRLMRVLAGLDWVLKAKVGGRLRLPCTLDVLVRILIKKWANESELAPDARPSIYSMKSTVMATAVYCLAFCGALRPSEVSVRNTATKGKSSPLRIKDITVEYLEGKPVRLVLWLPGRKNDQMGAKSDIAIGPTDHALVCAISRLLDYIAARKAAGEELTPDSLLFPVADKEGNLSGLTYEQLTSAMDDDLEAAGFNHKLFGGHSWRLGAATTLALNGVPEYLIKQVGGWSLNSTAFTTYIGRAPQAQRASFSAFLARQYVATPGQAGSFWGQGSFARPSWFSGSMAAVGQAPGSGGAPASALNPDRA